MSRKSKFTIAFNKKYDDKLPDRKKTTLAKFFKIDKKILDDVFDRGRAAYITNNKSVRKGVTSHEEWSYPRLYKFIMNVESARDDGKVNTGAGQDGDLVLKALNKKSNTFI